jgi:cell wall assembly regulator SMI1
MADRTGKAWNRIIRWLGSHAPATAAQVRGPAETTMVDSIERDAGTPLPAELRAWWAHTDGFIPYRTMSLIPSIHKPLPTALVRETLGRWLEIAGASSGADEDDAGRV